MSERSDTPPRLADERRSELLEAAIQIFVRYGFKKASMDEVARAAGLSRQGLYLHFPSKEALFRAGVAYLLERSLAAGEAALRDEGRPLHERLTAAFDAMHGQFVEGLGATPHMAELFETSAQLLGGLIQEQEQAFRDAVTGALERAGVAASLRAARLSTRDLAETLEAVSVGLKHRARSRGDYLERLGKAARLLCCCAGDEAGSGRRARRG